MLLLAACASSVALRADSPAPAVVDTATAAPPPPDALPGETGAEDTSSSTSTSIDGDLFDGDDVLALSLTIDDASWHALRQDGGTYAEVTLSAGDASQQVAIHIKGSSSWQPIDEKPSLVVDVNRYVDQRFMGVHKFYLQNDCYDPSFMSETLAYGFYREWGYPASRTRYARLSVNGDDYGLYTVLEAHDDRFLGEWFTDPNGNLYENHDAYCDVDALNCMEREEVDEGNDDAFRRLAPLLDGAEDWWTEAQTVLDGPRFVAYLALEASIVHWDSYSYDLSNYQLYHDPTEDRFTMLTQSMDLDFGYRPWSYPDCGEYAMNPSDWTMGGLAARCQADPDCFAAFVGAVSDYADLLEAADGAERVRELDARIADEVKSDPRRAYTDDADYDRHVECLQQFFDDQPAHLREWVAEQGE